MGDKNFRLSTDVKPVRYVFHVAPDLEKRTFAADGLIDVELSAPTFSVTLHASHLEVRSARVSELGATATITTDEESQTVTLLFDRELPKSTQAIELEWSGVFHEDMRGLYSAGGVAVTQFEAADARRVFPCFDEPSFKATWELQIEGDDRHAIISNSKERAIEELPGERRLVCFEPTPKMSSYLVAMVIGDLKSSQSRYARHQAIRTWAVPGKLRLTKFAQDCAAAVLPLLEDYFDHKYVFGKLDQVGIPNFEAGAMENSGCVTFREVALLVDPETAPLSAVKRVAEVITHELAHQWFGNLVTMQWWDDLWLNEAFATWMAYKIVDQWRPEWRIWDDFENGKATALYLDALESTHPIRYEVKNADQATENFDAITYEKGGAMLRMVEGYLGADAFRDGIRKYVKKHAFANAAADDLWNALGQASGQPIQEVANAWLGKGGYPVVEVARTGAKVKLSQRRFFADPTAFAKGSDETWLVPVVLKWADDAGVHETRHLLRERTGEVTLDVKGTVKFLCANQGGAGFYRVKYADADVASLAQHGASLTPTERMNLVADAWALFRAGAAPLSSALDLLAAFAADTDYAVLGEVVSRLDAIDRKCVSDADRPAFRAFVEKALAPQLARLGWEPAAGEGDATRLQRAQVVRALALVARSGVATQEAATRLTKFWKGEGAIEPNLLDAVHVAAARAGDAGLFEQALTKLTLEADPATKRRLLAMLASFEAPALVERAVGLSVDDAVPQQDASIYLGTLLANRAAQDRIWAFLQERWADVRKKTAAPMITRRLVEAMGELTHKRAEVEAFFDAQAESLATVPAALRQTRERLRLDEDMIRRAMPEVGAWLRAGG